MLLPSIVNIINLSLQIGTMPDLLKKAILTPVLKKSHLDHEVLGNYRPISNITFLSKLIEKVVAFRLNTYINRHGLLEKMQSAYRTYHSTETALLCVHNDILLSLDRKEHVVVVM